MALAELPSVFAFYIGTEFPHFKVAYPNSISMLDVMADAGFNNKINVQSLLQKSFNMTPTEFRDFRLANTNNQAKDQGYGTES